MQKYLLSLIVCTSLWACGAAYGQHATATKTPATGTSQKSEERRAKCATDNNKASIEDRDCIGSEEDGVLEAMHQEFEQTKDLALGYVPRQRLMPVMQKMAQQTATRGGSSLASNIKWTERGPRGMGGRTRAILVDPNDHTHQTVFAGSVGGGLWKSTQINNADPQWKPVNEFFANLAVSTICYDSAHPKTMYFGTGEGWYNSDAIQGDGIFKSTDGGATWNQLSSTKSDSNFYFIQKIIVDPKTSYVYAGTRKGLYRSKDGGSTWKRVLNSASGSSVDEVCDIVIGADDSLYVAMGWVFYGYADGIYKSFSGDSGKWVKKNTGTNGFPTSGFERIVMAASRRTPGLIWAATQDLSSRALGGIYKSIDGGNNWTSIVLPIDADIYFTPDFTNRQAWYDLVISINPKNDSTVLVGGVDLFKTVNAGAAWSQISHWQGAYGHQYVHGDQHAMVYAPGQSDTLYFGNDGGIFQSVDRGTTIISKDSGYRAIQFYACALNPIAGSNQMLGGAQDNRNIRLNSVGLGTGDGHIALAGDGTFCHIDQNNPAYQWVDGPYCLYYASNDSGKHFTNQVASGYGLFINPTDYSSLDGVFYGGFISVVGSAYVAAYSYWTDPRTGATWNANNVTGSGNFFYTSAITASPTKHYRLYVGTTQGKVYLIDSALSATPTITDITGSTMPAGTVKCIAIDPADTNHLIVTYSNYGINSIWETKDNGTSWQSDEGNLPDMPVRWALFDPNHSTKAIIATELGVWATDTLNGASTHWSAANTGLANVEVDMLKWRASDNTVIAATHGRGMFSTNYFTNAKCAFTRRYVNDSIVGGKPYTVNGKNYRLPGSYTDTLFHKATHCDSVITYINLKYATGIQNITAISSQCKVSPNPARNGQFNIDLTTAAYGGKAHIQVINLLGETEMDTYAETTNGRVHTTINNPGLTSGVYIVKVSCGTGSYYARVVVSR